MRDDEALEVAWKEWGNVTMRTACLALFTLAFSVACGPKGPKDASSSNDGGGPADSQAPTTQASPLGGSYASPQAVALSCDDGDGSGCAATYYTLDGSAPSQTSFRYTTAIEVRVSSTLKFFSVDAAGNEEAERQESYVIDTDAPTTNASPVGGVFNSIQTVALTCDDAAGVGCASTYYTTDGSEPSTSSASYGGPITVDQDLTVKFFSVDAVGNVEAIQQESYVVDTVAPSAPVITSPLNGTFLSDNTPQIDGTADLDVSLEVFDGASSMGSADNLGGTFSFAPSLPLAEGPHTLTVRAADAASNTTLSSPITITIDTLIPNISAVPPGGLFNVAPNVALSCTDGVGSGCAAIYFTTDGSDPSTTSPTYVASLTFVTDTTLKFFAVDRAGNSSSVLSQTYLVDGNPPLSSASPPGGLYNAPVNVVLSCDDASGSGCSGTYYTTDGSTPTLLSTPYAVPIAIAADATLKFFSTDVANNSETVKTETYVIDLVSPPAPVVSGTTPTNNTTPTWTWVSGGADGNGTFRYKVDNSDLSTGATETTATSYTAPSALADGYSTLYVEERDDAGNWSQAGSFAIEVDTSPPDPPTVSASSPTNDTTPTWTWSAGVGGNGTFRYKLDDSSLTTGATETPSSSYTSSVLTEGSHVLYVEERDAAGNWSNAGSATVVVDLTAPVAPTVTGTTPTFDPTPTWSWSAGGGGNGTFRYELDSTDFTTGATQTTATSFTPTTSLNGIHFLAVQERDDAGNWSQYGQFTIEVDSSPPSVTGRSPAVGATVHVYSPIVVTFDEPVDTSSVTAISFTLSDGSNVSGTLAFSVNDTVVTFTPDAPLVPTTLYTVTLDTAIQDLAGNTLAAPITWTFSTYTVNPVFPWAMQWNDYARAGSSQACDGTETGGYKACIHGGERRYVVVPGRSSCTGLTATDALGAFDWQCDGSKNPVWMVSTGLSSGVGLSALLDTESLNWLENTITVWDGGVELFTTAPSRWWENPVLDPGLGGTKTQAGAIYLVTTSRTATSTYYLNADKIAFVVAPGQTLSGSGDSAQDTIYASQHNFLWFEGKIDAAGSKSSLHIANANYSVVQDLGAVGAASTALWLNNCSSSLVRRVYVANSYTGMSLETIPAYMAANDNTLSDIVAVHNSNIGIGLSTTVRNTLVRAYLADNGRDGLRLSGTGCAFNVLSNLVAANNGATGIVVGPSAANNILTNITAGNNGTYGGVMLTSTSYNLLNDISSFNNTAGSGVHLLSATHNTLSSLTNVNNNRGVEIFSSSDNNTFEDLVAVNSTWTVMSSNSSYNTFTGLLKVGGGNCSVSGGTDPGLLTTSCGNQGSSNATLHTGVTCALSFVGKIGVGGFVDLTGDAINPDDSPNGTQSYGLISDWTHFENDFRTWGKDGSAFPAADNRGPCVSGETCRIWDWTLMSTGDTGDGGSVVLLAQRTKHLAGDAADVLTHTFSDGSTVTYLRNAEEIVGDGLDNENGLCESTEQCLFTPNIGSYQGEGNLISAGSFTDGASLSGIALWEYATNGF